jgi:hypothetical protein
MGVNGSPNAPVKSYNKDSLTNCQFRALLVHVSSARPALQHGTAGFMLECGAIMPKLFLSNMFLEATSVFV